MIRYCWILILILLGCAGATHLMRIDDAQIGALPRSSEVVVVNFWATWCEPCRAEIPALNRLHRKFPNVRFVGINLDDRENEGAIPGFLSKVPIEYEILLRSGSDFQKVSVSMDPQWKGGLPATFVFRNGARVFEKIGMVDESELETLLAASAIR